MSAVLFSFLLAACGGGGGGGGQAAAGVPPADSGGVQCGATSSGGSALVIGAALVPPPSIGNTSSLLETASGVDITGSSPGAFVLSVTAASGVTTCRGLTAANENANQCPNLLGAQRGLALDAIQSSGSRDTVFVLSRAPVACPLQARPEELRPLLLSFVDVGTFEQARRGQQPPLLLGGWVTARSDVNASAPDGSVYTEGRLVGYDVTSARAYGVSNAGPMTARVQSGRLLVTVPAAAFRFSDGLLGSGGPVGGLPDLTFDGAVVGAGIAGSVRGGSFTGSFTGGFFGPAGEEFAVRFAAAAGPDPAATKIAGVLAFRR